MAAMKTSSSMPKSVFQIIIVVMLVALTGTNAQYNMVDGVESEDPDCSNTEFYCQYNSSHRCRPMSARCLLESERTEQSCLNPRTQQEEGCLGNLTTGVFEIWNGWAPLQDYEITFVSRHGYKFKHEFVTYRGITYDFDTNGLHTYDINDQYYFYKPEKVSEYKEVGTSRCRPSDMSSFLSQWKGKKFTLLGQNCQDFAQALIKFLKIDCRGTHAQSSIPSDTETADSSNDDTYPFDKKDDEKSDGSALPTLGPNYIRSKVKTEELSDINVHNEHIGTNAMYGVGLDVLGVTLMALTLGSLVAIVIAKQKKHRKRRVTLLGDPE